MVLCPTYAFGDFRAREGSGHKDQSKSDFGEHHIGIGKLKSCLQKLYG